MRRLIWITLALAVLYAGYWVIAARGVETAVRTEVDRWQAAGLARVEAIDLAGFPSRFDLTLTAPTVLDRAGLNGWRAPFLQLFALSYRPNHVIAVWPHDQDLLLAGVPLTLTSTDLRASAVVTGTAATLDHMALVGKGLRIGPDGGADGSAADGLAATELRIGSRRAGFVENGHQLGIAALGLTPEPGLKARLDPGGTLPAVVDWLRLDVGLGFDRPIDRFAASDGGVRLTSIDLREFSLRWGTLSVEGKGKVAAAADGRAEGRVDLVARDWRPLVQLAVVAGLVRPEIAPTIEAALDRIDAADGDDTALRVPLTWRNGWANLGPLPLGAAPRF